MRYNEESDMVEIFYNGIWNEWKVGNMQNVYLYHYGDENILFTGGWTAYPYRNSNNTYDASQPTLTKNSSNMSIAISSTTSINRCGAVFAERPIDLTNFSFVEVVLESIALPNGGYSSFAVTSSKADKYVKEKIATFSSNSTKATIDISDLIGEHYFLFDISSSGGATANVKVNSIRLIK